MKYQITLALLVSIYAAASFGKSINQIMTPAGLVKVAENKVTIAGEEVYRDGSVKLHNLAEAGILIEGHHGGKHCPNSYHLINPTNGQLRILYPDADRNTMFGECRQLVSVVPELGLVIMKPKQPTEQAQIFAWNGKTMVETVIPHHNAQAQAPTGGDDVRRWIDKYLFEYLKDIDEKQRLLTILSEDELKSFSYSVLRGSPMYEKNGFVIGHGCDPDMCNANWAVLALRISDGAPFVLMADNIKRLPQGEQMPKEVHQQAQSMH